MSVHHIEIRVTPRPGLLDPEGQAIHHALRSLGYDGTEGVRVGKLIRLDLEADDEEAALATAEAMCRSLLANPVTEDYDLGVAPEAEGAAP